MGNNKKVSKNLYFNSIDNKKKFNLQKLQIFKYKTIQYCSHIFKSTIFYVKCHLKNIVKPELDKNLEVIKQRDKKYLKFLYRWLFEFWNFFLYI